MARGDITGRATGLAESRPPTDTKRVVEQKCTLSYATPPLTSEFDEPGPGETGNQRAARVNRVRVRLTAASQQHTAALRAAGRARIVPGRRLMTAELRVPFSRGTVVRCRGTRKRLVARWT